MSKVKSNSKINKTSRIILCGDPDNYGSDCGRKFEVEAMGCTMCTKYEGGCPAQKIAESIVTITVK